MIIGGIELLICGIISKQPTEQFNRISEMNIDENEDREVVYVDEIEVLERYAFKTVDEYEDIESGYSSIDYYVYDADEPMDKNELMAEYYVVKFCDSTGSEYVTSLSVSAKKDVASRLINCPLKIPACVFVSYIKDKSIFLNSYDIDLINLRENALDEYSSECGIPRANITFSYQSESINEQNENIRSDYGSFLVRCYVFGVILIIGGACLLILGRKKN